MSSSVLDGGVHNHHIPKSARLRLPDGHYNSLSDERRRRESSVQRETDARQALHDTRAPRQQSSPASYSLLQVSVAENEGRRASRVVPQSAAINLGFGVLLPLRRSHQVAHEPRYVGLYSHLHHAMPC